MKLLQVIDRLIDDQGVEAVILGGTELPLVLTDASHRGVPLLDTTRIHVEAALRAVAGGYFDGLNSTRNAASAAG